MSKRKQQMNQFAELLKANQKLPLTKETKAFLKLLDKFERKSAKTKATIR